jgi:hypothetical protein
MSIGLVIVVAIGVVGGYFAYQQLRGIATTSNTVTNDDLVNDTDTTNVTNTPGVSLGTVKWTDAVSVPLVNIYLPSTDEFPYDPNIGATMESVGTVTSGTYQDATVIRHSYQEDGPVFYRTYAYLLKQGDRFIYLAKNSAPVISYEHGPTLASFVTVNYTEELPGLRTPDRLNGPKERQVLQLDGRVSAVFSESGLTKVFTDPTYGPVYTKSSVLASTVDFNSNASVAAYEAGEAFKTRNGFYVRTPDGMVSAYRLVPDIGEHFDEYYTAGTPTITWTDGSLNSTEYHLTLYTGCGSLNYINVVQPSDVSVEKDLVKTGTTKQGDAIYEFKNTQAKLLKDFYTQTIYVDPAVTEWSDNVQIAYDAFLAKHPMVFWVDPFGRLIQMTNSSFSTLAECGKPVVYLYPTTTTNVDVTLQPKGGFTKTEPAYGNGWKVTAEPNGRLTERATGKVYPYLFWEGRGGIYTSPDKGFVVAQNDVHGFLVRSLAALGLNEREAADFIEFWEPRMQGSPFYRVSFFGNRVMDELAPMAVSPAPDTVIRVLMDFVPLSERASITPQSLHAPERRGFTVVEWGGVLR